MTFDYISDYIFIISEWYLPIFSNCLDTWSEFSQSLHLKHLAKITEFNNAEKLVLLDARKSDNPVKIWLTCINQNKYIFYTVFTKKGLNFTIHLVILMPFLNILPVSCVKVKSWIGMHPSWAWIRLKEK